ncbi:eIF2A-related protein [Phormidesmis sp. 146-12]
MADVFISYSRKDKPFVQALYTALSKQDREVWIDWQDIPLTADWWQAIEAGIEAAETFVFVISPDSIASQICCKEIAHAVRHHKRLVPVVWRDDFDIERVYPTLRKHNWLFLRSQDDFETGLRSLLKAIDTDLDHVRQHTRLLTHAIEWQNKNKNPDLLLQGSELEETIQWLTQNAEKEPRSTDLQREYINASRKAEIAEQEAEIDRQKAEVAKQKKLRQATNAALIAVMSGLVIATGLGIFAFRQYQTAETSRKIARVNEIKALSTSSNALFHSNQDLDALVTALKAVSLVQSSTWADSETQNQVRSTLQQAIYGAQEQNRIEGKPGVTIANFSPDGKLVAMGNAQGEVKLQSTDGQKLQTLKGHSDQITGLSFSSDGKKLITASKDGTIKLWSIDGKELKSFEMRGAGAFRFSPDGKTFIFSTSTGAIKLWSLEGRELLNLRSVYPNDLAFSPDGKTIAAAVDKTVKLWDMQGRLIKTLKGHKADVTSVGFSPDGKTVPSELRGALIATASLDKTVKLWSREGRLLQSLRDGSLATDSNWIARVQFSPDSKRIAITTYGRTIEIWTVDGQKLKTINEMNSQAMSVKFSPDEKTITSASWEGTIRVWNLQDQQLKMLSGKSVGGIKVIEFSPDGKVIAIAGENGRVKLLKRSGQEIKTFAAHEKIVTQLRFSLDGKTLLTSSDGYTTYPDSSLKLWTSDGRLLKTFRGQPSGIPELSLSPDGQSVVTGDYVESGLRLWSLQSQKFQIFRAHNTSINSAQFSPDGRTIASADERGTIQLWNLKGQVLKSWKGHSDWIGAVRFSPDGQWLVSGGNDSTIKFWNLNGQELKTLKGHTARIQDLKFSPDGKTLVSASKDKTIKFWNLEGQELKTIEANETTDISSIAFSPDGQLLASVNNDNKISFWNTETSDFNRLVTRSCDWLKDYLINHPETLKDITTCQNSTLLAQASATLVRRGEESAKTGDVKAAIAQFQQAKEWNPQLDLNAETMAQRLADRGEGERLISEGEDLAKADKVEEAIAKFQTAQKLGADLNFDPRLRARQVAAVSLITKAEELVQQGEVKQAIAHFDRAKLLAPTLKISVDSWDDLCWYGSLHGQAAQVMDACEKAVAFSPPAEVGYHRDSRGVARAMMGDRTGAIADFEAYIAWTNNPSNRPKRKRWIAALKKGKNPFTPKEIESLLY